ncbi:MAG: FAD:protein FMN transferase [Deltaproteobacteria bacterium]|nr:FAD:protein FMN transferase [Deltaproteobacteria bacterium]
MSNPARKSWTMLFAFALLSACKNTPADSVPHSPTSIDAAQPLAQLFTRSHPCMGTRCDVQIFHTDTQLANTAFLRAFEALDRVDVLMSTWLENSDVSRINQSAGLEPVVIHPETFAVIQKAPWLGDVSEGAFDLTVGVFRGLWKFDEDNDGSLPSRAMVKERLKLVNYRDIILDETKTSVFLKRKGMKLTLGGTAKGYAVDAAVKAIRDTGIQDFIVQAGGDLFASGTRGDRKWRVGIRDPRGSRESVIYKLELSNGAFNTSGDYERFVLRDNRRYHHILDARTGFPSMSTRSVTVLADTSFDADMWDTMLFVMGPEKAMALVEKTDGIEAVIIDADNHVHISSGLRDRLTKVRDPSPGI